MASSTCTAPGQDSEPARAPNTQIPSPWTSSPPRAQSHSHKGSAVKDSYSEDNGTILHAHRQNHNSSKLPAFRFADRLKKDSLNLLPPLLQQQHIPPSPVSPSPLQATPDSPDFQHQDTAQRDLPRQSGIQRTPVPSPAQNIRHNTTRNPSQKENLNPVLPETLPCSAAAPTTVTSPTSPSHQQQSSPTRTRASTLQAPTPTKPPTRPTITNTSKVKRPASFPEAPIVNDKVPVASASKLTRASTSTLVARSKPQQATTISDQQQTPNSNRSSRSGECAEGVQTKEWAQRQRDLVLPKSTDITKAEDKRRSRPPVSFRAPNAAGGRPVIPPIRAFRSSGSRKSLVLDMHTRRVSDDSNYGEDITDPNVRDRTLRALEGRTDDEYSTITPPDSATATPDDNTAEIFMKIAREDPTRRTRDDTEMAAAETQSVVSRLTRTSRRRPLSAAVLSYKVTSPPQVTRRLSDQRETLHTRCVVDEQSAQQTTRELTYRAIARDRDRPLPTTESNHDEVSKSQASRSALRSSPLTPRQISFQEATSESSISSYSRRRASLTENNGFSSRASQLRTSNLGYGSGRTYNSSPLVPKSTDARHEPPPSTEVTHAREGTESSTSTAAPSTVWDELDDLKSRIHRLELTGKLPASSVVAMSRTSDDRPPTATTNATTVSASPKRGSGQSAAHIDVASTTSSHKEQQPILLSALNKTKTLVKSEVFSAIESAASEALALASMMGTAGQPGPISSGASTIGGPGGTVTDRQLRKKADSICRSLTELCLALAEETSQPKAPMPDVSTSIPHEKEFKEMVTSPTTLKPAAAPFQRRPSANASEQSSLAVTTSPRAPTSLEQRRLTMLNTSALPSPRYAPTPKTPSEFPATPGAGRKSSLIIGRARRAGTEEPEEQANGRKSSLLLRTRRAGTDEPEETRESHKPSLLLRTRRDLQADQEDESQFRAPSRANTDLVTARKALREPEQTQTLDDNRPLATSALPRRRLIPSSLSSRLAAPASSSPTTVRRFFERSTPERDTSSLLGKLAEDRGQRAFSLGQTAVLNKTSSINRRRESAIPSITSP